MDLSEIIERVRINIVDNSTVSQRLSNERLTRMINDSISVIAKATRAHTEDSDVTITSGGDTGSITSAVLKRYIGLRFAVDKTSKRELHIRKIEEINEYRNAGVLSDSIQDICTIHNQQFVVAPKVNANRIFTLTLYTIPVDLVYTSLNGETTLPSQLHPVVVLFSSAYGWRAFEEENRAKYWEAQAIEALQGFIPDNLKIRKAA